MKEEIIKALNKIGYKISGRYPNEYIFNHKGENTGYRVMGDRIEPADSRNGSDLCFYYKGIEVYELEQDGKVDCIGIKAKGNDDVFLQFYNHDLNKPSASNLSEIEQ